MYWVNLSVAVLQKSSATTKSEKRKNKVSKMSLSRVTESPSTHEWQKTFFIILLFEKDGKRNTRRQMK